MNQADPVVIAGNAREQAFTFDCEGETLVGVAHLPVRLHQTGVLVVVGGPQYRAGSHRQFLLLARRLADDGYPCMRFDYRGMGDSTGPARSFDVVNHDLRAAVDAFVVQVPSLRRVILWGLCDGASACCFYAATDPRVFGAVLVNPWVRTEQGQARALVTHYYRQRLFEASFWKDLLRGRITIGASIASFFGNARRAFPAHRPEPHPAEDTLAGRMAAGIERSSASVLLLLSGNDLTAEEFRHASAASPAWQRILNDARTTCCDLPEADHTFSRAEWRDRVAASTLKWLQEQSPHSAS